MSGHMICLLVLVVKREKAGHSLGKMPLASLNAQELVLLGPEMVFLLRRTGVGIASSKDPGRSEDGPTVATGRFDD